jgi:hypothetical protein
VIAHPVQRSALAAFVLELAGDGMVGADEMVVQGELVTGGAAQANRVPDVGPRDVFAAHQHGALLLDAVVVQPRRAVSLEDRTVGAEPGGVAAAGGKGPHARDAIAAFALDRLHLWPRSPRQHCPGVVAEDRLCDRQVEVGGRHRAAAGLAQAPGRGGVGLGDGLHHMEKGDRVGLDPVGGARQQQAEQFRLVQAVEQGGRQPPLPFDLVGGVGNRLADGLGTGDHVWVARQIDRECSGHGQNSCSPK